MLNLTQTEGLNQRNIGLAKAFEGIADLRDGLGYYVTRCSIKLGHLMLWGPSPICSEEK
jgi:hypothetical protein